MVALGRFIMYYIVLKLKSIGDNWFGCSREAGCFSEGFYSSSNTRPIVNSYVSHQSIWPIHHMIGREYSKIPCMFAHFHLQGIQLFIQCMVFLLAQKMSIFLSKRYKDILCQLQFLG